MTKNVRTPRSPLKTHPTSGFQSTGNPSTEAECPPSTRMMLSARHPSSEGNRGGRPLGVLTEPKDEVQFPTLKKTVDAAVSLPAADTGIR